MTKTIYIVGLGLIGSSIALGIRRNHPDYHIVGYNRSEDSRRIALENGIVDEVAADITQFASEADIIFLCVPIQQTIQFIEELANLPLKDEVLVTDAGSTKGAIVAAAQRYLLPKNINFLGGHPMAGSHKTGAIAADVNLFENAYYILTPSIATKEGTTAYLQEVLSGLHARFVEIDAREHDRVTSQISHFPHVLASSLMNQAGDYQVEHPFTQHFAAGGFRDMTRIAESEPSMWTSILLSNSQNIVERLEEFTHRLKVVKQLIESGDAEAIWQFFHQGRHIRQEMEIHRRAGVDSFYDLFINIPDQEDAILTVLELLRGISVANIRINEENRADIYGILQITFKNEEDLRKAERILCKETSYQVFIK